MLYRILLVLYNIMKNYSIEYTRSHFKDLLEELPFGITRYRKIVAKVVSVSSVNVVQDSNNVVQDNINVVQDTSRVKTPKKVPKITINSRLCKHGAMRGLCKKGCQ